MPDLEAVLIKGVEKAVIPEDYYARYKKIQCKAAAIVPIQRCMIYGISTVECDRVLRLYEQRGDIKIQHHFMKYQDFGVDILRNLVVVKYDHGRKEITIHAPEGKELIAQIKNFNNLAELKYAERTAQIESYVSNWLNEVFKDGT